MPGRDLSQAAITSTQAEQTDEVWLALVTINHDDLAEPIRCVDNNEDITSEGETFVGLPFEIELPADGDGPGETRLKVDNVDRVIVNSARTIQSPPSVSLAVIMASNPDEPELTIDSLIMRDVSWDAGEVRGTLRFEDITTEPVAELMTPARFPGLH